MARLNGGELLLDLINLGDITTQRTLNDEQWEQIKKITSYDSEIGFKELKKPIFAKVNVNNTICLCLLNVLSEDLIMLIGRLYNGSDYMIYIDTSKIVEATAIE